jgi:hypothetical protein
MISVAFHWCAHKNKEEEGDRPRSLVMIRQAKAMQPVYNERSAQGFDRRAKLTRMMRGRSLSTMCFFLRMICVGQGESSRLPMLCINSHSTVWFVVQFKINRSVSSAFCLVLRKSSSSRTIGTVEKNGESDRIERRNRSLVCEDEKRKERKLVCQCRASMPIGSKCWPHSSSKHHD